MRFFDTKTQAVQNNVLKECARDQWAGTLADNILDLPARINPKKVPSMRCCIYKERAILTERIKMVMEKSKANVADGKNVIRVLEIACDDCPSAGYQVTDLCRGCLSHRCDSACKKHAIRFVGPQHAAQIDKSICVDCGACAKACPFDAIVNRERPCQRACKPKAIEFNEEKAAKIIDEKCIQCGSCVYQCPFGAIVSKSFILETVNMLKEAKNGGSKVYAMVAPAIASQFNGATYGQVIEAIYQLGFEKVFEVAYGADLAAVHEAKELSEKGFLISSCCPAFVTYIHKYYPDLVQYISSTPSPMVLTANYIKEKVDKDAKVVFIGPCTAKKQEVRREELHGCVDVALTFEELMALIGSKDIDLVSLPERETDDASYFGRIFARSGGLCEAVNQSLAEQGINFTVNPIICSGIDEIKMALLKKSKGVLKENFIEGMACVGGCVNGAGNLNHGDINTVQVNKHSMSSKVKKILDSVNEENTCE